MAAKNGILFVLGAMLIGLFQNCGPDMQFQNQAPSEKAALVPVPDSNERNQSRNNDRFDDRNNNADMKDPRSDDRDDRQPPRVPAYRPPLDNKGRKHCREKEGANKDLDTEYACIIDGAGKSQRIALIGGALGGDNSTPSSVCMSQVACEDLISKKFVVKSAERRGYCQGNPNVIRLSDEEILELLK